MALCIQDNGPVIEASIVHTRSGLIRLRFVQQVRRELLAGSLLEFLKPVSIRI